MTPFTFLIDDTATEIPARYAISSESAISIIEHFLATGGRHPNFSWESI